jgi:hypothetical protein
MSAAVARVGRTGGAPLYRSRRARLFEQLRPGGRLSGLGMASGSFSQVTDEEAAAGGVTILNAALPSPELLRV